jgi:ribosome maturation factor RimP
VGPRPAYGAIRWAIAIGAGREHRRAAVAASSVHSTGNGASGHSQWPPAASTSGHTTGQERTVSSAQLAEQLESTVAGAVRDTGLELEELNVAPAGRRRLVRVVVDTPDGGPLDLDAVADVSRAVSAALDSAARQWADELLGRAYTLEVSSPGLDRPLTRPRHWRRAHLRLVKARTTGGAELLGRVGAADEHGVVMLVDGAPRRLEFATIDHAVVQVEFAEPPAAEVAALTAREE